MVADKRSRENKMAIEILYSTLKFNEERYEVGLLWDGNQSVLSNNIASALGQLGRLKRRIDNNPPLKKITVKQQRPFYEKDMFQSYILTNLPQLATILWGMLHITQY